MSFHQIVSFMVAFYSYHHNTGDYNTVLDAYLVSCGTVFLCHMTLNSWTTLSIQHEVPLDRENRYKRNTGHRIIDNAGFKNILQKSTFI